MNEGAGLVALLLLIAAVVLFVLAAFVPRGWMVPVGLACFAGSFLLPRLLA